MAHPKIKFVEKTPPPYDLETETFNLHSPQHADCEKLVRERIYKGVIPSPPISLNFERDFTAYVKTKTEELHRQMIGIYNIARKEFQEKLNAKYGSFENRMEHQYSFAHFPPSVKGKIHYYCYERGHHSGEDEISLYYSGVLEIVEEMEECMKARKILPESV